jgi:hypothetical protein
LDLSGNGTIYNNTGSSLAAGFDLGTVTTDIADAAGRNFYPKNGSLLINKAVGPCVAQFDFNGTRRDGAPDIGAYEFTSGTNPGWSVQEGFKIGGPLDSAVNGIFQKYHLRAAPDFNLFPNPAGNSEKISFKMGQPISGPATLTIYDALGRRVFYRKCSKGLSGLSLPAGITPGRYMVRFQSADISKAVLGVQLLTVR